MVLVKKVLHIYIIKDVMNMKGIYKYTDLKTGEIRNVALENGYVKASFGAVENGGYYYLFQQKLKENTTTLDETGLIAYFDGNDDKIVSYKSNSNCSLLTYLL